ncbi:MAG: hypothetical protein HY913_04455 [Desulfomonile tiedjei]|nr:hypothetical protein [Desulfomonile tiedjei]
MEIDLNITMPPKKKTQADEPQRPEVWPTLLQEEELVGGPIKFHFYDAATTPVVFPVLNSTNDYMEIEGDHRESIYRYSIGEITYRDPQNPEKTLKKSILVDGVSYAQYQDGKTYVYHNETKSQLPVLPENIESLKVWKDVDNWSNELSEVFHTSDQISNPYYAWKADNGYYSNDASGWVDSFDIKIYMPEQYDVSPERIVQEFGTSVWDRKPLGGMSVGRRNNEEEKIWYWGSGFFNIRIELKSGSGKGQDQDITNADKILDHKGKFKDNEKHCLLSYKYPFTTRKMSLRASEVGSGTRCHYLNITDDDTFQYHYDTLNVDGIFFRSFDTSDNDTYKVTRAPRYDAPGIGGSIISCGEEYDIGFVPRRWAYYCRTRERSVPSVITVTPPVTTVITPIIDNTPNSTPGGDIVGEGSPCYNWLFPVGGGGPTWAPSSYVWHGDIFGVNWAVWTCHPQDRYYSVNRYRVGVWWDRFPSNIFAPSHNTNEYDVFGFFCPYPFGGGTWTTHQHSHTQYAFDTYDAAHQINDEALCGNRHMQLVSWNQNRYWYWNTQWGILNPEGFSGGDYYASTVWRKIGGFPLKDSNKWTDYTKDWIPQLGASSFWLNYGIPSYQVGLDTDVFAGSMIYEGAGSMWDMIPYGVGISPDKAGALVGIIRRKKTGQTYFIWRKVDEVFTLTKENKDDGYEGHSMSFERNGEESVPRSLDDLRPPGGGFQAQAGIFWDSNPDSPIFIDQFRTKQGENRVLDAVGRSINFSFVEPDPQCPNSSYNRPVASDEYAHDLPAIIVPMITLERAIRPPASYRTGYTDRWNDPLYRYARGNGGVMDQNFQRNLYG